MFLLKIKTVKKIILKRFNDKDIHFEIFEYNEIDVNEDKFCIIPDLTDKFKKKVYKYFKDGNYQFMIESKSPFIQYEVFKSLEDLFFFKRNCFLVKNGKDFFAYYKINNFQKENLNRLKRIEIDFYDKDYKKELYQTLDESYLLIYHYENGLIGVNIFNNIKDLNYVEPFK